MNGSIDRLTLLQKIYLDALKDYKAGIDQDGDIEFIHPDVGTFFIVLNSEADPEYLNIRFMNFMTTEDGGVKKEDLIVLANEINHQNKAVKITVSYWEERKVWIANASIEAFVAGPDELPSAHLIKSILRRNIGAIRNGVNDFRSELKKLLAEKAERASPILKLMRPADG